MLAALIHEAQTGNKETMMLLINKFQPIIKKYSKLLNDEDAGQELTLFFLQFILDFQIGDLNVQSDYSVLSYIKTSIHNQYIHLLKKRIAAKQVVYISSLSEAQKEKIEYQFSTTEDYNSVFKIYLKNILNKSEYMLIYYIFILGYNSNDLAKLQGVSRQSVNQKKKRILDKLKISLINSN